MALAATHSPLVSNGGLGAHQAAPALVPVRVVRAICIKGQRVDIGTTLQIDRVTASDLITGGKAVRITLPPSGTVQAPAIEQAAPKKPAAQVATLSKKESHHVEQ